MDFASLMPKQIQKAQDLTCTTFCRDLQFRYLKLPEVKAARQAAYGAERARLEDEEVERVRGEETQTS
jgi:hypothetical protein